MLPFHFYSWDVEKNFTRSGQFFESYDFNKALTLISAGFYISELSVVVAGLAHTLCSLITTPGCIVVLLDLTLSNLRPVPPSRCPGWSGGAAIIINIQHSEI